MVVILWGLWKPRLDQLPWINAVTLPVYLLFLLLRRKKKSELTRPPEEVSNCHCSECCLQNEVTVVLSLQTPLCYALKNSMVVTHRLTTCPKSKCLLIFGELCLTAVSFKIDPMPSLTF